MPRRKVETNVSDEKLARQSFLLGPETRSWWVLKVSKRAEDFCIRHGLTPNTITLIAVGVSIATFLCYATGHVLSAGWLVLLTGTLDLLDGRVARATKQVTIRGGFLDAVADRYQDFFILSGICFFYRSDFMLLVILLVLGGSMLVSYVRARAETLGVDLSKIGEMQRPERIFLLGFGSMVSSMFQVSLMPFWPKGVRPPQFILAVVLIFMAVSNHWTALRRIRYTMRMLKDRE